MTRISDIPAVEGLNIAKGDVKGVDTHRFFKGLSKRFGYSVDVRYNNKTQTININSLARYICQKYLMPDVNALDAEKVLKEKGFTDKKKLVRDKINRILQSEKKTSESSLESEKNGPMDLKDLVTKVVDELKSDEMKELGKSTHTINTTVEYKKYNTLFRKVQGEPKKTNQITVKIKNETKVVSINDNVRLTNEEITSLSARILGEADNQLREIFTQLKDLKGNLPAKLQEEMPENVEEIIENKTAFDQYNKFVSALNANCNMSLSSNLSYHESVINAAKELAEKAAKELAEKAAKELAEKAAQDLAEKAAKESAEKAAKDLADQKKRTEDFTLLQTDLAPLMKPIENLPSGGTELEHLVVSAQTLQKECENIFENVKPLSATEDQIQALNKNKVLLGDLLNKIAEKSNLIKQGSIERLKSLAEKISQNVENQDLSQIKDTLLLKCENLKGQFESGQAIEEEVSGLEQKTQEVLNRVPQFFELSTKLKRHDSHTSEVHVSKYFNAASEALDNFKKSLSSFAGCSKKNLSKELSEVEKKFQACYIAVDNVEKAVELLQAEPIIAELNDLGYDVPVLRLILKDSKDPKDPSAKSGEFIGKMKNIMGLANIAFDPSMPWKDQIEKILSDNLKVMFFISQTQKKIPWEECKAEWRKWKDEKQRFLTSLSSQVDGLARQFPSQKPLLAQLKDIERILRCPPDNLSKNRADSFFEEAKKLLDLAPNLTHCEKIVEVLKTKYTSLLETKSFKVLIDKIDKLMAEIKSENNIKNLESKISEAGSKIASAENMCRTLISQQEKEASLNEIQEKVKNPENLTSIEEIEFSLDNITSLKEKNPNDAGLWNKARELEEVLGEKMYKLICNDDMEDISHEVDSLPLPKDPFFYEQADKINKKIEGFPQRKMMKFKGYKAFFDENKSKLEKIQQALSAKMKEYEDLISRAENIAQLQTAALDAFTKNWNVLQRPIDLFALQELREATKSLKDDPENWAAGIEQCIELFQRLEEFRILKENSKLGSFWKELSINTDGKLEIVPSPWTGYAHSGEFKNRVEEVMKKSLPLLKSLDSEIRNKLITDLEKVENSYRGYDEPLCQTIRDFIPSLK